MRLSRALAGSLLATLACPCVLPAQTCEQNSHLPRPITLGVSGGSINTVRRVQTGNVIRIFCGGGTLGALVQDPAGHQFVLSNNHVIGRSNAARPGEAIVQPGLQDVQCKKQPASAVARFSRRIRLDFGPDGANPADAAIARVRRGKVSERIHNIGPISGEPATPVVGLAVQKMGATTCLTHGIVAAVGVDAGVQGYGPPGKPPKTVFFQNQILVTMASGFGQIAAEGDSGSVVVTTDACPRPVGLLFAGGPGGNLVSPLEPILSALGVSFVEGCSASAAAVTQGAPMVAMSARIASAAATRDVHRARLMRIAGAIGTGIGLDGGKDAVTIDVYVTTLTPEARAVAPAELDGVPVRIRETGAFVAL